MSRPFPLQAVLEHRLRMEEQRQQEVSRAEAHLAQTQGQLRLAEAARAALLADIGRLQTDRMIDAHAIIAAQRRLAHAGQDILQAQAAVMSSQATLAATKAAAIAASQGRLALEKLRDAYHAEIQQQANHAEAEYLGQMGLIRWLARQAPGEHE